MSTATTPVLPENDVESVKHARDRIQSALSGMAEVQIRYLAVHLDIARKMQDKWLTDELESARESFSMMLPFELLLSRDPKDVKYAKERLAYNKEWTRQQREKHSNEAKANKAKSLRFGI